MLLWRREVESIPFVQGFWIDGKFLSDSLDPSDIEVIVDFTGADLTQPWLEEKN